VLGCGAEDPEAKGVPYSTEKPDSGASSFDDAGGGGNVAAPSADWFTMELTIDGIQHQLLKEGSTVSAEHGIGWYLDEQRDGLTALQFDGYDATTQHKFFLRLEFYSAIAGDVSFSDQECRPRLSLSQDHVVPLNDNLKEGTLKLALDRTAGRATGTVTLDFTEWGKRLQYSIQFNVAFPDLPQELR